VFKENVYAKLIRQLTTNNYLDFDTIPLYSKAIVFLEGSKMKIVIVDYRIDDMEKKNLQELGFKVLIVPPSKILYEAVKGHPDMLMHFIGNGDMIVHKDMDYDYINNLINLGINVKTSTRSLQACYPYNISLNAVNLNNLFMHNLKYTDAGLLASIKNKKIKNVKQGYTKCSTAIVKPNAIMTSDRGIAICAEEEGIDVLLLPPGDIILPGLDYGFIGGCCGLLGDGALAFYGNIKHYLYGDEVLEFLNKHDVKPVFLRDGKLVDRGSIFTIQIDESI
jgi:hypothetical protein